MHKWCGYITGTVDEEEDVIMGLCIPCKRKAVEKRIEKDEVCLIEELKETGCEKIVPPLEFKQHYDTVHHSPAPDQDPANGPFGARALALMDKLLQMDPEYQRKIKALQAAWKNYQSAYRSLEEHQLHGARQGGAEPTMAYVKLLEKKKNGLRKAQRHLNRIVISFQKLTTTLKEYQSHKELNHLRNSPK